LPDQRPARHPGEVEARRGDPVDLGAPPLGVAGTGELGIAPQGEHLRD